MAQLADPSGFEQGQSTVVLAFGLGHRSSHAECEFAGNWPDVLRL